ncbi:MAG: hypothetical protein JOZ27_00915 [Caulobacteraceae bacterium]|nr:hypothetical protein [Caulobacteraceae bacterium]
MKRRTEIATLAACAALALAGCGKGSAIDTAAVDQIKDKAMDRCLMAASQYAANSNLDVQKLCDCAVEKIARGRSAADLMQMSPHSPELKSAAMQCMIDTHQDMPTLTPDQIAEARRLKRSGEIPGGAGSTGQ